MTRYCPALAHYQMGAYFYLGTDKKPVGPFQSGQMLQMYQTGKLTRLNWIWAEGKSDWQTLENVLDISDMFSPSSRRRDLPARQQSPPINRKAKKTTHGRQR